MSILKIRRIILHPWFWWQIVKVALVSDSRGERTAETRRRMASLLKILDDALDPDLMPLAYPHERVGKLAAEKRRRDNEEFLQHDPVYGKLEPGYRPLPEPERRLTIAFPAEDVTVIENSVESYAKRADVDHAIDQGFVDVLDALKAAEIVEIDTEQTAKKE